MKQAGTLLACVCALALAAAAVAVAQAPTQADSSGTPATTGSAAEAEAASIRVQRSYRRWRRKLARYRVWHGRNLVRAARSEDGAPTTRELRSSIRRMRRRFARWSRTYEGRATMHLSKLRQIPSWGRAQLRSIAWCESRNNPRAVSANGAYRGLYQFSFSTWRVVGGTGDPAAAPRSEQTWRAWALLKNHGSGHWPVCG